MDDEMAKKLSNLISNFKNSQNTNNSSNLELAKNIDNFQNQDKDNNNQNTSNSNQDFGFNNIDLATLLKFKNIFDKVNTTNDPRANLLIALKPYLKAEKKDKIEQYIKLLNMSKIIEAFKDYNDGEKIK